MTMWLQKLQYGDDRFEGELTAFWLNGDLVISPEQQLDFLARMFRGELTVNRAHIDAVASALLMPAGSIVNAAGTHPFPLAWPAGTQLRAKTGSTAVGGERVNWLVGQIESQGRQYVFAARARGVASLPTPAGVDVARRHLDRVAPR